MIDLRALWYRLRNRSSVPELTEAFPAASVYFDDDQVIITSKQHFRDRTVCPTEPICRICYPLDPIAVGGAIYEALKRVHPPLPADQYDSVSQRTFQAMGISGWTALEQNYWHIACWEQDGSVALQTMRKARRGGYVAFQDDAKESSGMDQRQLGAAAIRAIDALNRSIYIEEEGHT